MKAISEKSLNGTDELYNLAAELRSYANGFKVWAFYGEIGAGKTTFIRQICKLLGVKENVSSPTFSLINEYSDINENPVYHFDFFRIENEQQAVNIGCEEYFESGSLCLIEWPEKILNLLPHPYVKIVIRVEETKRTFTFSYE